MNRIAFSLLLIALSQSEAFNPGNGAKAFPALQKGGQQMCMLHESGQSSRRHFLLAVGDYFKKYCQFPFLHFLISMILFRRDDYCLFKQSFGREDYCC